MHRRAKNWLHWAPPAQQVADAVRLIQPASENLTQCASLVVWAIRMVQAEKAYPRRTRAAAKRNYRTLAKALRTIESSNSTLTADDVLMERVQYWRKICDLTLDGWATSPGSKQKDAAKEAAVLSAYELLANFGDKPPTKTREGPWHRLAGILLEDPSDGPSDADVFHYMRNFLPPPDFITYEVARLLGG